MKDFEYITLNTNGVLRDVNAKSSIFKTNRGKIVFLQETHTTEASRRQWEETWEPGGRVCFSHGTTSSAGVATLIPEHIKFISEHNLMPGRILLTKIEMNDEILNLVNIYNYTNDNFKKQVTF